MTPIEEGVAPFFANLVMCSLTCKGTAAEGLWQESSLESQQCNQAIKHDERQNQSSQMHWVVLQLALEVYLCLCCFHP